MHRKEDLKFRICVKGQLLATIVSGLCQALDSIGSDLSQELRGKHRGKPSERQGLAKIRLLECGLQRKDQSL